MPYKIPQDKLVPTEAIRELTRGSFEHLSLRIDDEIQTLSESATFDHGRRINLARVATFRDKVVVGTNTGEYYSVKYEDTGDRIKFGTPEPMHVPVLDRTNTNDYVQEFTMKAVDSIIAGKMDVESLVALMNLKESIDDNMTDLTTIVTGILASDSPWKSAYKVNYKTIRDHVGDLDNTVIETKYSPLYDGTLEEEKFAMYLEPARRDLGVIFDRLTSVEEGVDASVGPFVESINRTKSTNSTDVETIKEFREFADGVVGEIHNLREHVKIAIEHEQCAMCLGQIHDAIANSLADYELAGAFVQNMASQFAA